MIRQFFKIIASLLIIGAWAGLPPAHAAATEDTMLMFVGEDLDVLSIASRREESARQAPAVASVVTRDMMTARGMFTLSDVLAQTPGFYMAQKEWGTRPYLRGIPDSVLFLYDTVPMQSDMSKSVHPLDDELSLAPVKRIEIIRGPGSMLWGADAFAGIVNVVPMTGKDLSGVETGVFYGNPGDPRGGHVSVGHDAGEWDAFVSVTGREGERDEGVANTLHFWDTDDSMPFPPEDRYGEARPERPHFMELVGNINFRDWITLSGRYSDYTKPYAMSDKDEEQIWAEQRADPVNYVKLEGKKNLDVNSALRFTGYCSEIDSTHRVIDLEFDAKEYASYGELICDRKFLSGQGLLTAGAAYRNKQVSDAPIWDSYLPDYLGPENLTFLPGITQEDYRTELWSFFGQYSHKIGKTDVLFGLRHDAHDTYADSLSYNLGLVWSPASSWTLKTLYGTAYRTPFARQLMEEEEPDLEEINTGSLEVSWQPEDRFGVSLCGFVNHIADHIMEDAYAGLSNPNHQKIYGLEAEARVKPMDGLELAANVTAMSNSGPDETYLYNDYSFLRPDGTIEKHYVEINYPFDTGPDTLLNLTAKWSPVDAVTLFCRTGYFASQYEICSTCDTLDSVSGVWLTDASLTIKDILNPGLDVSLYLKNITDREYRVPGTYSTIEGDPFSVRILVTKRW